MTAEFNWWLLLLGLVVGGGLTWLVLADTRRREQDLEDDELGEEAAWLEARMAEEGQPLPAETLEHVVRLHRAYLAINPSDDMADEAWLQDDPTGGVADPWEPATPGNWEPPTTTIEPSVSPSPTTPEEPAVRHEVRGS